MNRLHDKKTGRFVSMKKMPEVDTNKVIDIWFSEEKKERDDISQMRSIAELVLILLMSIAVIIGTVYMVVRI